MTKPKGCRCKTKPMCTLSGMIRCNARIAWLLARARKFGHESWTAINPKTNLPFPISTKRALDAPSGRIRDIEYW